MGFQYTVRVTLRPATVLDAMDFAGGRAFLRKALVFQVRNSAAAYALEAKGEVVALAMFWQHRPKRQELALAVRPGAAAVLPGIIRLAHLTLSRLRQSGIVVFSHVRETDLRAQRMARIGGFVPGKLKDRSIWFFRGVAHERIFRDADGIDREKAGGPECADAPATGRIAGPPAER